jgi:MFS transporter, DHA1 family, inner membrane transport protein
MSVRPATEKTQARSEQREVRGLQLFRAPRFSFLAASTFAGIAVIISSYVINAMDRTLFPLILPEVAREYDFNLPEAGLMATVFTIGMAIAGVPSGYLMSRIARRKVAQTGLLIFSAATLVTIASGGFADMLIYRALTGIGEAMQLTALLAILSACFVRFRGAAVGALNCAFGLGAVLGPLLGAQILSVYGSWRAPMVVYGLLGFLLMLLFSLAARKGITEAVAPAVSREAIATGMSGVWNRNTVVLTLLSAIAGLSIFGFLGMYPTYLRAQLHFVTADAGRVMSIYGLGVLVSVLGGFMGDRFSTKPVLVLSFLVASLNGWLLFNGPAGFGAQAALAFAFGVIFSGAIYVNIAAGYTRAVAPALTGRASGIFVTSFYAAASVAGYVIGWLAEKFGWTLAGDLQLSAACIVGALLALALHSDPASIPRRV